MSMRGKDRFATHLRLHFLVGLFLISRRSVCVKSSSAVPNEINVKFDFAPKYWDLVAQAMAHAKCLVSFYND